MLCKECFFRMCFETTISSPHQMGQVGIASLARPVRMVINVDIRRYRNQAPEEWSWRNFGCLGD